MAPEKMPRRIDLRKTIDTIEKAHATEIGRVVISWNRLGEELGKLFAAIINSAHDGLGLAAWHAVSNDRSQRGMLEATARMKFGERSKFCSDLKWALGKIQKLEDDRNNTLHSPYAFELTTDGEFQFIADSVYLHKRAQNLRGRQLDLEFQSYTVRANRLASFIRELSKHLDVPDDASTWPGRPHLPRPAQPMLREPKRPRKDGK